VWPDGPSPALSRRIAAAAQAAAHWPDAPILCSGAAGRVGPSEASVMAGVLTASGVDAARLALDEASRDTLQSAVAAARFVRLRGLERCIVCSDGYHVPRIRMLLRILGVRTLAGPRAASPKGFRDGTRMRLREGLAIAYDAAVVLARRRSLLREIAR
jgi:uncharacterized SAM-binding protein YcdF (DUF218 family)